MKGNLYKSYDFASVVTKDDLRDLFLFVTNNFEFVKCSIKTKDGAEYNSITLEEVLQYDNCDYRKIICFSIKGNKDEINSFSFPNISITLCDNSVYDKSFVLDIRDLEENEIVCYVKKIEDFVKRIRVFYWFVHKVGFYIFLGCFVSVIFALLYSLKIGNNEEKVYNFLILQSFALFFGGTSVFWGRKLMSFLYPEFCFCIGEQERYIKSKEKMRAFIFGTILVGLVIGIVASIISHFILSA